MCVLVLGATGRVGGEVVRRAGAAGHKVTAFVRDPAWMKAQPAHLAVGDIARADTLRAAVSGGVDVAVNAVGAGSLKLSTDTARAIGAAMHEPGVRRTIPNTGTAQMPKTALGAMSVAILRRAPVGNAIRDHQGAFGIVTGSSVSGPKAGRPPLAPLPPPPPARGGGGSAASL